jgi:hypothetical protein
MNEDLGDFGTIVGSEKRGFAFGEVIDKNRFSQ